MNNIPSSLGGGNKNQIDSQLFVVIYFILILIYLELYFRYGLFRSNKK
jgi:hypothetical protein